MTNTEVRTRAEHGREINDVLFINDMKHMDKHEDGFVEFDPQKCAFGAIMKALVNYIAIVGKNKLAKAFLWWIRENMDPKKYNVNCDPNWRPEEAQAAPAAKVEEKGA